MRRFSNGSRGLRRWYPCLPLAAAAVLLLTGRVGSIARAADRLTISMPAGQGARLQLQGTPSKDYAIQATDALSTGNWTTLATGATDATGSFSTTDPAGQPARFYRAARLPDLQPTTTGAATVAATLITIVLGGTDPLNPGGALVAIITQLPDSGTLYQADGTPITAAGTTVSDAQNRVFFIPPASASGSASFAYALRRTSNGVTSESQSVTVSLDPNWIFSSFDDATQGLQCGYSLDGIHWSKTGDLYGSPTGDGVRDSSIVKLNGSYYVAYTAGYFGGVNYVQICRSTDLRNWTYLCNVSTDAPGYVAYSWAPEWFVDADGTVYLYLARPDQSGSWRLFYTTPTRADLTTWNPIQKVGGDMLNRGAIDGQVVRDGSNYYLVYRNYGTPGGTECVEMARGTSPTAFSLYKTGDWAGWGTPREGPCLVHLQGPRWRIYMILAYPTPPVNGSYVTYSESSDGMATWTPLTSIDLPQHGTCYALRGSAGSSAVGGGLGPQETKLRGRVEKKGSRRKARRGHP